MSDLGQQKSLQVGSKKERSRSTLRSQVFSFRAEDVSAWKRENKDVFGGGKGVVALSNHRNICPCSRCAHLYNGTVQNLELLQYALINMLGYFQAGTSKPVHSFGTSGVLLKVIHHGLSRHPNDLVVFGCLSKHIWKLWMEDDDRVKKPSQVS